MKESQRKRLREKAKALKEKGLPRLSDKIIDQTMRNLQR